MCDRNQTTGGGSQFKYSFLVNICFALGIFRTFNQMTGLYTDHTMTKIEKCYDSHENRNENTKNHFAKPMKHFR